jgi:simple sugar transport system ATP-binding protein
MAVRRGEIFGIGGVDGNGQGELAEALAGLRKFSGGTMLWEGAPFKPGVNPAIGYIPQDRRRDGLATTMTIEENLVMDAVARRSYQIGPFLKRRELRMLADDLIRRFDVRTPGGALPASALSGGNQQKVVIARALNGEPDLIVAVNPTRGLDIAATRFVHEQLAGARRRGACVVLISTDMDEVLALSDEVAILSAGRLTAADLDGASATDIGLLLGGARAAQGTRPPAPNSGGDSGLNPRPPASDSGGETSSVRGDSA